MTSTMRYRLLIGTVAALGLTITVAITYDGNDPAPPAPRAQRAPIRVIVDAAPERPSRSRATAESNPEDRKMRPSIPRPSTGRKKRNQKPVIVRPKKRNPMG